MSEKYLSTSSQPSDLGYCSPAPVNKRVSSKPKYKSEYWKLLEHPLWQQKRLEICKRDGFRCLDCDDAETQLHVHHAYYVKGRKPWEYPNWSLRTVCKKCHKETHDQELEPDERVISDWEDCVGWLTRDFPAHGHPFLWDLAVEFGMAQSEGIGVSLVFCTAIEAIQKLRAGGLR